MSEARITSGTEWIVARLIEETSASPGLSVMGGYERRVASNHQDSSVPSFNRESNPLLPLAVGKSTTEPFIYGEEVVGCGLMAVTVTGPTT